MNNNLERYNKIVWISIDALRADAIRVNKDKLFTKEYKITTRLKKSKLDEICNNSCFFNNTISAAPYTSTSHSSYFTGLWPKNHGVYDQINSKLKAKTIFEIVKNKGYTTLFKTDFPFILGKSLEITNKGIDNYYIEDNEKPLKELTKHNKVFAFFHFGQVHYPYGFHNLKIGGKDYKKKVTELEKEYKIQSKKVCLKDMLTETFRTQEDLKYLYRYKTIIEYLYSNKKDSDLFNLYLEGINRFHEKIFNKFLDKLLKKLSNDKYLIIISADHGEAWNDHTYGHYNSLDEGVIRVPLMFFAKDIPPKVYKNRVRTIDVFPTLIQELFGQKLKIDGKSLSNIIYNNKSEPHRMAFASIWMHNLKDITKAVKNISKNKKLITKPNSAMKFAATLYSENYKLLVNYKSFGNRGKTIIDNNRKELFKINSSTEMHKIHSITLSNTLEKKLNIINKLGKYKKNDPTKTMRKYFNLLGYKI